MSQYDKSSPALAQALLSADQLSSDLVVCSSGRAVQSSHLPQEQVPFSYSSSDIHPPEEEEGGEERMLRVLRQMSEAGTTEEEGRRE